MIVRRTVVGLFCVAALVAATGVGSAQPDQPFEVVAASGLETGGDKEGGVAWGDYNNDGCPDVAVNTDDDTVRTRLLSQIVVDGVCTTEFVDDTAEVAPALLTATRERSVVWGDIDNDGALDLVRNGGGTIELYRNGGAPDFTLELAQEISRSDLPSGGLNSEGLGLIDYDADGLLELIADSHEFGIVAFDNLSADEPFAPDTDSGLPASDGGGAVGDYLTVGDYDGDGDVDLLDRRGQGTDTAEFGVDLFENTGGSFVGVADLLNAPNQGSGGKGGVTLCDLDNDLDLDAFWTDGDSTQAGVNQVWVQDGVGGGTFSPSGIPSGVTGDIDGVSCGDVDNDGDRDLILTSDGLDQLLINGLVDDGALALSTVDLPGTAGNGEGSALADMDGDGDLDLVINQDGANVLLENTTNDDAYLQVHAREGVRAALGATAWLEDCAGASVSGLVQVNGGSGHGSQDGAQLAHFGLGAIGGPEATYVAAVRFVGGDVVRTAVVPGSAASQNALTVSHGDVDALGGCEAVVAVSIAMPADVVAGESTTVDVVIINTGGVPAGAIVIVILLDGGVAVGPLPSGCTGETEVVCVEGDLAPGATLPLSFSVDIPANSSVVGVTATVEIDGVQTSTASSLHSAQLVADLTLNVNGVDAVTAGSQLLYSATVTNAGPSNAVDVLVASDVPSSIVPISVDVDVGGCLAPHAATHCLIDVIEPGAGITVTFVADVPESTSGAISAEISVTAASVDPDPTGNLKTFETIVGPPSTTTAPPTIPPPTTTITGPTPPTTDPFGGSTPSPTSAIVTAPPAPTTTAPASSATTDAPGGDGSTDGEDGETSSPTDGASSGDTTADDDTATSGADSADDATLAAPSSDAATEDAQSSVLLTLLLMAIAAVLAVANWTRSRGSR